MPFQLFPRKPRITDWTPEQTELLRRLAGKRPAAEIAAELGRTLSATLTKAQRAGIDLPMQPLPPDRHSKGRTWESADLGTLRRMAQTHTQQEVADALGRTPRAVKRKSEQLGIAFRKHGEAHHRTRHSAETIRRIWELRQQGWGRTRIAREVGMDNKHVYLILNYGSRYREMMALDSEAAD